MVDKTPRGARGLHGGLAGAPREVQNAQRVAAIGMSLRQCGQACVVASAAGSTLRRAMSAFTGLTTKKKTTAAMITNASSALMKSP